MKILKIVLLLAGVSLIAYGIYSSFAPQQAIDLANVNEDLNNQTFGMIGIGVLALLAGLLLKKRS